MVILVVLVGGRLLIAGFEKACRHDTISDSIPRQILWIRMRFFMASECWLIKTVASCEGLKKGIAK
nr:hypothetical protein [uncultured bacterium]